MISQERLKQVLDYDPATGVFTWKVKTGKKVVVGKKAGGFNAYGYRVIGIDGKVLHASRLAWLYVHGEWPVCDIDHINGDRSNDALSNLRHATRSQNQCNRVKQSNNTSGFKGVYFCTQTRKWKARITVAGKTKHLGSYPTPDQAGAVYADAAKSIHGEFARI